MPKFIAQGFCSRCEGKKFELFMCGDFDNSVYGRCCVCHEIWASEVRGTGTHIEGNQTVAQIGNEQADLVSEATGEKTKIKLPFDRTAYQREYMRDYMRKRRQKEQGK